MHTFGESWGLLPSGSAVTFTDNHDSQRGGGVLTYKDGARYDVANYFLLAHPYGYPKAPLVDATRQRIFRKFRCRVASTSEVGPSRHAARTCVAGQTCALDGFEGQHLGDGSLLAVLDTCGLAVPASVPRYPNVGLGDPSTGSGSAVTWGVQATFRVTAPGGQSPAACASGLAGTCF